MKKNDLKLINLIVSIVLIAVVFYIVRPLMRSSDKVQINKVSAPIAMSGSEDEEKTLYDIDKIRPEKPKAQNVNAEDLATVYANYPKEDVGDNMSETWSKVNPEEKTKLLQGVDTKISEAREKLKLDPNDKKAKAMLAISESLKNMAANDFNYKKD